jgi:penicillin-binding protein 2
MPRFTMKDHKDYLAESRLFTGRVIIAVVVVLLMLCFLLFRLWQLQVYDQETYVTLSNENHLDLIPIDPNRGLIYDRNGALLAENIPVLSLDVIPDRTKNFEESLDQIKDFIHISEEEMTQFRKALRQRRSYDGVTIKQSLTEQEAADFYVNQYKFPGFKVTGRLMRYYPYGDSMVSVLGYVGRINEVEQASVDPVNYAASKYIGKLGVEKFYEDKLHGKVGYQQVETDVSGRIVRILQYTPPVPGEDLHLSIDVKLQKAAEDALGDYEGSVIAINPKNGEVLAFVSNPRYDPNPFVTGISQKDYSVLREDPARPLYNRALRGLYPAGSTVKPFYGIELLDGGYTTERETIYDNGFFHLPGSSHVFKDWNYYKGGHGTTNLRKAIVESCDVYFYNMSLRMRIAGMFNVMNNFGFGRKTGLDVYEELGGVMPNPDWKRGARGESWYPGDTVNTSIGQGYMLVTPLQLASAMATLANRGIGYRPRFAMAWERPDSTIEEVQPTPSVPVMLKESRTWDAVLSAMQGVTEDPGGTARRMRYDSPYTIGAKTGTAQVFRPKHYGDKDGAHIPSKYRSHSWLIAFAPVENPQIALAALVEHNPGKAVGVAKQVLDYYLLPSHGVDEDETVLEFLTMYHILGGGIPELDLLVEDASESELDASSIRRTFRNAIRDQTLQLGE